MLPLLPPNHERTDGDCLRCAVAVAYGFPYRATPAVQGYGIGASAFWAEWQHWAEGRGKRLWLSDEIAPVSLPIWIASVDADGEDHAVVMGGDQFVMDPTRAVDGVAFEDVRAAIALIPLDQKTLDAEFRPLRRPLIHMNRSAP